MSNITDYLENGILNYLFRNVALTQPTSIKVGLWTAAPTDAVGAGEVSGGSYARATVAVPGGWNAPSGGVITNNGAITFPTASAPWGTVSHVVLYDHTGTNPLYWGALAVSKVVGTGDTFTIPSTTLSITMQ